VSAFALWPGCRPRKRAETQDLAAGFPGFAALNPGYVPFLGRFSDFGFCCNLLKIAAALEKSAAAPMSRARRTPTLE